MIAHSQGIGDHGQRGPHARTGGEEAAVYDVEVVYFVGAAVEIEYRRSGIGAKATGTALVRDDLNGHFSTGMNAGALEAFDLLFNGLKHVNPAVDQPVVGFGVVGGKL